MCFVYDIYPQVSLKINELLRIGAFIAIILVFETIDNCLVKEGILMTLNIPPKSVFSVISNNHNQVPFYSDVQSFSHLERKFEPKEDIYSKSPVRLLGFTNEVGAALSPLIGPVGELVSYAPALSYIFMDVKDKYRRGEDGTYCESSTKKAFEQLAFQTCASVVLPTAAVKTAQSVANKIIDSKFMFPVKDSLNQMLCKNRTVRGFISKFADNARTHANPGKLTKFAVHFQKALNIVTVAPMLFKQVEKKSGARNIGLTIVGLSALAAAIKPIDYFTEKVIIGKCVKPLLNNNQSNNRVK